MERLRFSYRFWQKVSLSKDCWEWNAARNRTGYGLISRAGKCTLAHRASWELHHGKIADGMHVLHRCDNPRCVNPGHLFLGTDLDNARDKISKGRQVLVNLSAEEARNRKLDWASVNAIRKGRVDGISVKDLARQFKTCAANVYLILKGDTWKTNC